MRQHLLISSCESVIHAFQLAHLRVFQSYFFIIILMLIENVGDVDDADEYYVIDDERR